MSKTDQLFTSIVEEFTYRKKHPSKKRILSYLFSLKIDNFRSEFVKLVGRTLHFKPKFFMESLYPQFREKLSTIYGDEKRREIEQEILEKFCLHEGEHILFKCEGTIKKKVPNGYKIEVPSGNIFTTNHRFIAEGTLKTSSYKKIYKDSTWKPRKPTGAEIALRFAPIIVQLAVDLEKRPKSVDAKTHLLDVKKAVLYYSIQEESPCYGYVFPITFPRNLGTKKNSVLYNDDGCIMDISSPSFKVREKMDQLMDILEEILEGLVNEQKLQEDCPKCSLSRKIKLSRCSWCGKIILYE